MSNIGDARLGSRVPSCDSSSTRRLPRRLICTSKIEEQAVQKTPMPEDSYTVIKNSGDNSLGNSSKTIRQVVKKTPMPEDSYTVTRPKTQNLTGSSSGDVSETVTQNVQKRPRPESGDIAAEKRITCFQALKNNNGFVRAFMKEQLLCFINAIHAIPITDPTIKKGRSTLLKMVDCNVIMSQTNKDNKAAREKLLSFITSGEKTLDILEQYSHSKRKQIHIKKTISTARHMMKKICDFIQCFDPEKMKEELDQSKTYDDLLKMTDGFKQQNLQSLFMDPLDKSIWTIGECPDKDAQAAELITILQQIPHLTRYIAASEQASSSNVMRGQESGTSNK